MSALPAGFDALYHCKNHAEREASDPIALRLCPECHEQAMRNYVDFWMASDKVTRLEGDPANEGQTPWGEDIKMGRTRVRKRKVEV